MEYWKPEHPPPTTPMRRPAGRGSCVAIISRTLAMAPPVKLRGACFGRLDGSVKGCAMVAMSRILPGDRALFILRRRQISDKFYPNYLPENTDANRPTFVARLGEESGFSLVTL